MYSATDGVHTFASEALDVKEFVFRQFDGLTFAPLVAALTGNFAYNHKQFHCIIQTIHLGLMSAVYGNQIHKN